MYLFCTLAIAALLGLIPANIAKEKGYSFGLWWFYGWMLFIVAIIHVQLIPDKNANNGTRHRPNSIPYCPPSQTYASEESKEYKELIVQGDITEEFEKKK